MRKTRTTDGLSIGGLVLGGLAINDPPAQRAPPPPLVSASCVRGSRLPRSSASAGRRGRGNRNRECPRHAQRRRAAREFQWYATRSLVTELRGGPTLSILLFSLSARDRAYFHSCGSVIISDPALGGRVRQVTDSSQVARNAVRDVRVVCDLRAGPISRKEITFYSRALTMATV